MMESKQPLPWGYQLKNGCVILHDADGKIIDGSDIATIKQIVCAVNGTEECKESTIELNPAALRK